MRHLCLALAALLLALAGCGGGDSGNAPVEPDLAVPAPESSAQPGAERPRRDTLVAALGDSITAGSPLWDPDPSIRAAIGSSLDPRSRYEYWLEQRRPGVRFRNCGVFGERTDEIAARLDGCARGADALIVQGGINDIGQMRSVTDAARNLRTMVQRGKRMELRVKLVEVLPWNNGGAAAAPRIRALNRAIAQIGREEDVPVFPWYSTLEDPAAPGNMKPEWTIDGDHPSVEGYRRLAGVVRLR